MKIMKYCIGIVFFVCVCMQIPLIAQEPTENIFQDRLYHFKIPEEIGSIEHRWQGTSGKTLLLIQDSHISLEVQLNIAKIIELFVNDYDVSLVNIEGADHEKIDFQELRELEPRDIVEKVSLEFLKESRINGAVYAKINSEKDFVQYGIEDKEAYLQNYKYYLAVVENNQKYLDFFSAIKNTLMKKKARFISKDLGEFLNLWILFKDGDVALTAYFKRIIQKAKDLNIELMEYPSVMQLLEVALDTGEGNQFANVDNKALLSDLDRLGVEIRNRLAATETARAFMRLLLKLFDVQELLRLRILPQDYERYQENKADYREYAIINEIKQLFPEQDTDACVGFDEAQSNIEHFYSEAQSRNDVLFRNTMANMETEKQDISIIVSGGFHTDGLVSLCEEKGVSYARIMPMVTSSDATVQYEERMLQLKSELIGDSIEKEVS